MVEAPVAAARADSRAAWGAEEMPGMPESKMAVSGRMGEGNLMLKRASKSLSIGWLPVVLGKSYGAKSSAMNLGTVEVTQVAVELWTLSSKAGRRDIMEGRGEEVPC